MITFLFTFYPGSWFHVSWLMCTFFSLWLLTILAVLFEYDIFCIKKACLLLPFLKACNVMLFLLVVSLTCLATSCFVNSINGTKMQNPAWKWHNFSAIARLSLKNSLYYILLHSLLFSLHLFVLFRPRFTRYFCTWRELVLYMERTMQKDQTYYFMQT